MRSVHTHPLPRPDGAGRWRARAILVALIATLALIATMVLAPPARAVEDVQPARAAGETRIDTAIAVAERAYPDGSATVVVAPADDHTHTLAATPLAGALDAPILLTWPDVLPEATVEAVIDLGAERIVLAGGTDAVSDEVQGQLAQSTRVPVDRIGADDPYRSAADLAEQTLSTVGDLPTLNGMTTVALASGEVFPDALSIAGPAAELGMPLLLTLSDGLAPDAATTIEAMAPQQVLVIGGEDAVSAEVAAEVDNRVDTVTRLGGINRTDTAAIVADHVIDAGVLQARTALLARGDAFPDAVTAGVLSAALNGPTLLTATPDLPGEQAGAWFIGHCDTIEVLQVIGGEAAVTSTVANGAESLAESCDAPGEPGDDEPTTAQTYAVDPQQALSTEAPGTHDFTIARRYDGDELGDQPLDLVLFPCASADVTGGDADTFADADGDGDADGFASTDTGSARIAVVNGEDVEDQAILQATPDEDGDIDVRLASDAADCTVMVVVDGNGNGALDLDADGTPVEDYGVGQAEWT